MKREGALTLRWFPPNLLSFAQFRRIFPGTLSYYLRGIVPESWTCASFRSLCRETNGKTRRDGSSCTGNWVSFRRMSGETVIGRFANCSHAFCSPVAATGIYYLVTNRLMLNEIKMIYMNFIYRNCVFFVRCYFELRQAWIYERTI